VPNAQADDDELGALRASPGYILTLRTMRAFWVLFALVVLTVTLTVAAIIPFRVAHPILILLWLAGASCMVAGMAGFTIQLRASSRYIRRGGMLPDPLRRSKLIRAVFRDILHGPPKPR
jgi:hypothetical protein